MATALSDYLFDEIVDAFLRLTAPTLPSNVYVALFTAKPGLTGSGGAEVSATGYTRQTVTFTAPSGVASANSGTLTFTASAPVDWGTITAFAVMDAATGGNMLLIGDVSPSLTVLAGTPVSFGAGELAVNRSV